MTTARTIKTSPNQREASFRVLVADRRGQRSITCYLFHSQADGIIWILQQPEGLQSTYSDADVAEMKRLNAMAPVRDGDVVQVEGQRYTVKVNGDYSDAGYLIPITR